MNQNGGDAASPRDEALAWWREQIEAERYAGGRDALPGTAAVRYLRSEGLLAETPGGWGWVVLGPNRPDTEVALRQNYWSLVRALLESYAPAALERISAVRAHIGEAHLLPTLHVVHDANKSKRKMEVAPGLSVALRPANGTLAGAEAVEWVEIAGVSVPVLSSARALLSLTLGDVRDDRDLVLAWLRSLVVSRPELEGAYEREPRHILLARFGHLAEELGNRRLAAQVGDVLAARHRHPVSRTNTGVGSEIVIPTYLSSRPSLREPWADRFRARLARAAEVACPLTRGAAETIEPLSRPATLARAREAKAEDTYHSTTIEGYRITRDDVRAVLEGTPHQGRSPQEIERIMALKGYSQAFERTLSMIGDAPVGSRLHLAEGDVLDLYLELWGPSIDAGIARITDLRGWRKEPVYIRRSAYVPPGDAKVPTLMRVLIDSINEMDADPIARAAVMHWGFVHVHPFVDGNGRISRLLMNLLLCSAGMPWTTVRVEERDDYFAVLEAAHVSEDYSPLATFVRDRVLRSAGK